MKKILIISTLIASSCLSAASKRPLSSFEKLRNIAETQKHNSVDSCIKSKKKEARLNFLKDYLGEDFVIEKITKISKDLQIESLHISNKRTSCLITVVTYKFTGAPNYVLKPYFKIANVPSHISKGTTTQCLQDIDGDIQTVLPKILGPSPEESIEVDVSSCIKNAI